MEGASGVQVIVIKEPTAGEGWGVLRGSLLGGGHTSASANRSLLFSAMGGVRSVMDARGICEETFGRGYLLENKS